MLLVLIFSSLSMTSAAALKKTLVGYFSRGQEGSFLDELVLRSRQDISAAPNVRYKMHICLRTPTTCDSSRGTRRP
jgi:hypothetical protein